MAELKEFLELVKRGVFAKSSFDRHFFALCPGYRVTVKFDKDRDAVGVTGFTDDKHPEHPASIQYRRGNSAVGNRGYLALDLVGSPMVEKTNGGAAKPKPGPRQEPKKPGQKGRPAKSRKCGPNFTFSPRAILFEQQGDLDE